MPKMGNFLILSHAKPRYLAIDHIRNVSTSVARNALWDCVGGREEERRDICIERVGK